MAHLEFSKEITALLVIDPYKEFIPREASSGIASSFRSSRRPTHWTSTRTNQ